MYKIDGISYLIQLPCDLIALIRHRGYSNYDRKKEKKKEVINRVNRFPDILAKKKKKITIHHPHPIQYLANNDDANLRHRRRNFLRFNYNRVIYAIIRHRRYSSYDSIIFRYFRENYLSLRLVHPIYPIILYNNDFQRFRIEDIPDTSYHTHKNTYVSEPSPLHRTPLKISAPSKILLD